MSVKLNLPRIFSSYINNQPLSLANGNTVGDCLDDIVNRYPVLKNVIFEKDGKLVSLVNIYINKEEAYSNELSRPVNDGNELTIVLSLE